MERRDIQLDNIKAIMIFLVVYCHCNVKLFPNYFYSGSTKYINYAIYSFHMPVFVFLSGFFGCHSFDSYKRILTFSRYFIPYLIINTTYQVYYHITVGNSIDFLSPAWTLWYLLSLFVWAGLIQCMPVNKKTFMFYILIALGSGLLPNIGEYASISRTIAFFPYYIAGYYVNLHNLLDGIRKLRLPKVTCLFIITHAVIMLMARFSVNELIFELRAPYSIMGQSALLGIILRCFSYVAGFVGILFVIRVIPSRKTMFSIIGQSSFTIYIMHPAVILLLNHFIDNISNQLIIAIICLCISAIICFMFGNKHVYRIYKKVSIAIDNIVS